MKLQPTPPGIAKQGLLSSNAPLRSSICPECPWRYEMIKGFNIGIAADHSMMEVAKTGTSSAIGFYDAAQSCHMNTDQRCRGAETFKANTGLVSEVQKNPKIAISEEDANYMWDRRRGYKIPGIPT